MLFHKDEGDHVGFTELMSCLSVLLPTKANLKLDHGNTRHSQVIRIILYYFHKFPVIYTLGPVYYFPGHTSNSVLLDALKCYVGFQKVASENLEHCDLVYPQYDS